MSDATQWDFNPGEGLDYFSFMAIRIDLHRLLNRSKGAGEILTSERWEAMNLEQRRHLIDVLLRTENPMFTTAKQEVG